VRRCLENWNKGDNGILNYSKAYRFAAGTGWLVPPCILHAPGSLVTYEPAMGFRRVRHVSSLVEGRYVPWQLLVKDVPDEVSQGPRLPGRAARTGPGNVNPSFKDSHYLEPITAAGGARAGYEDKWIVTARVAGEELFTAKS